MLFRLKECKLFLILYIFALLFAFISCENPFMVKLLEPLDPKHKGLQMAFTVSNEAEWISAVDAINRSGSNRVYIITVTDDFSIPGKMAYDTFDPTDITVSIYGAKTISLSSKGSLFHTKPTQSIIMHDVNLKGLDYNSYPLVNISGNFTMESGSISGNFGSGVSIDGTFTMNGGEISDNTAIYNSFGGVSVEGTFIMNGGKIRSNTSSSNYGGNGVSVDGTFIMNGGEISGNTTSGYLDGGGVNVRGTFIMNGGEISGNTATGGGGVCVTYGTFTMNGGEIKNNTAYNGGGVYLSNGTFTMSGGKITSNTSDCYGGGVFISGTFTMNGGEIKSNTANVSGGGVYVSRNATFVKSRGGIIYGNDAGILSNTAGSSSGHAVYWDSFTPHDATLGVNDNMSVDILDTGWANAVPLTANIWTGDEITSSSSTYWFSFTAITDIQTISINFDTLKDLNFQVFDGSFNYMAEYWRDRKYTSLIVISGQKYYIRVIPYGTGTYRIAFNTLDNTPLTSNVWTNGNIPSSNGEEWFSFIATADTQYIQIIFGSLTYLYFEVFSISNTREMGWELRGENNSFFSFELSAINGQKYYMRVWLGSGDGGTYKISFNTSKTVPP